MPTIFGLSSEDAELKKPPNFPGLTVIVRSTSHDERKPGSILGNYDKSMLLLNHTKKACLYFIDCKMNSKKIIPKFLCFRGLLKSPFNCFRIGNLVKAIKLNS